MSLPVDEAIVLGHPSYAWRFGQERRLALVAQYVDLKGKRILDIGCGIGTYTAQFTRFSRQVYGIDVDEERVRRGRRLDSMSATTLRQAQDGALPCLLVAQGESLPFLDGVFDMVFLHEVLEHVADDRGTVAEAFRVTRVGGCIVIYCPNRLYPFETHGIYLGKDYHFGVFPLVNYLPDSLRRRLVPHARAYGAKDLRRLFAGVKARPLVHRYVYPGFDGISSRHPWLASWLRQVCYFLEKTPLRVFGLSHFLVMRREA